MKGLVIVFAIAVCVALSAVQALAIPVPVGHWTMDDDAADTTVVDSSVYGNHGTAQQNTSILHTTGIVDGALTFNGISDYIDSGSDLSLQEKSTLTFAAWINGSSYAKQYNMIVCGDQGNLDFSWGLRVDNSIAKFFIRADGYRWATGPSLSSGQWYHVAGVWDRNGGANNLKIYVDGQLKGQTTVNADMDAATVNASIGRVYYPGINQYFAGLIDNVMIFNEALSADDITAVAHIPEPATITLLATGGLALIRRRRR